MRCPYCASGINDDALVCAVCRRDIQLAKQLGSRIQELEAQLAILTKQVAAQDVTNPATLEVSNAVALKYPTRSLGLYGWFLGGLVPLTFLLGAHWLIVVTYDLNTLFLRIVSLLIPLPFGLLLTRHQKHYRWEFLLLACGLSYLAVLGMSGLTAMVDNTPVLPHGWREWREFAEYATSIGLSLIAGGLLGHLMRQHQQDKLRIAHDRGAAFKLAEFISSSHKGAENIGTTVNKIKDLGNSLSVAGASAASAYMGLKDFLGN
ncbi:MAG: hypothetical protein WCL27_07680 [Betaproteobacteria bacterium]